MLFETLLEVAKERLRDAYIDELIDLMQKISPVRMKLYAWQKTAGENAGDDLDKVKKVTEEVGKNTLTNVLRSRLHIK